MPISVTYYFLNRILTQVKKVLLLIPTETYRAQRFIEGSEHLGIELTIASPKRQAMADSMGDRAFVVAIDNPATALEQIKRANDRVQFDAIVSIDDLGLKAAALASEQLGLKHISTTSATLSQDKIAMRKRLAKFNVLQPNFNTIDKNQDFAIQLASLESYPIVVKPATLSGSIGVIRAETQAEALSAVEAVYEIQTSHGCDKSAPLLIEQYIPGTEFAVEAIVISGKMTVLSVFEKPEPLVGPYFTETIYLTPPALPQSTIAKAIDSLDKARSAIGITTGPIHAEFRVTEANEVYFIELAARSIGGMCSKAVPLGGSTTLEELILAEALNIGISAPVIENQSSGVYMIPVPSKGKLTALIGLEQAKKVRWITEIDMTTTINSTVVPVPFDSKYLGFIFAKGPSNKVVLNALKEAFHMLKFEIS